MHRSEASHTIMMNSLTLHSLIGKCASKLSVPHYVSFLFLFLMTDELKLILAIGQRVCI